MREVNAGTLLITWAWEVKILLFIEETVLVADSREKLRNDGFCRLAGYRAYELAGTGLESSV